MSRKNHYTVAKKQREADKRQKRLQKELDRRKLRQTVILEQDAIIRNRLAP